ncbi:MAG TPA: 2-amino-4-hydroxy-6-hydroxymethyldihydropteridine diphosphokinase [Niabella sp.]|nr:2-amino-4-hydroxy-6-hydroxymethyldihydropteridine diphosphokinase [Chitinophagaceae bacterium]HRN47908.1 2-amino-4-hydroxy-6-hydroxymethyldihydropteridine diphosphokinase [Niabella sp.]HRO83373.1 2-amino-4-hydroxy-6-hydroxymethyldihydropteridine diphosphokinase [Niabella sp.]HUN02109.1 2-amino-4-hydroxy-6-hydroxymethyldihydropteridine diphosphokinase [Niabella sp.]
MNNVFLIIGSNLGNKAENLKQSIRLIEQSAGIVKKFSAVYETEPWGVEQQPAYYNQVLEIITEYNAEELMTRLLNIEKVMGRIRINKYDARNIDIDILFFNDEIYNSETIIIPHPRLHLRRFVLVPLAEIAPEFVHPVFNKNIFMLLDECEDSGLIKKI